MKLFIGLAFITVVWASPIPEQNINLRELQDVIPADIYARSDEKDSAVILPQLIEVARDEADGKIFPAPANSLPIIEPLNGPVDINAENSIEDDFDDVSADEILDDTILAVPLVENEEDVKTAQFESDSDENSPLDEIQIVDLDSDDVRGFMGIAPSELESIRVYFNEDMARELNDQHEQGPELIRLNKDDPYLR